MSISERRDSEINRELDVMKKLASIQRSPQHFIRMLDDFNLEGPNGTHKCLVFELLGPNIPDMIDARFPDGRLPAQLAKAIAKQALFGLDILHQQNIGHGGKSCLHIYLLASISNNCYLMQTFILAI